MNSTGDSAATKRHSNLGAEDKKLLGYYDRSGDDNGSEIGDDFPPKFRKGKLIPTPSSIRGWVSLTILTVVASLLGAMAGYMAKPRCTERECIRMTSLPSPLLDVVELYDTQFEAELDVSNVWKGHPRPELDAAWDRAGRIHLLAMPDEYRVPLNKTDSGIPYPEERGGGIMVEMEVFHQIHCLNLLRQVIYAEYYMRPGNMPVAFEAPPHLFFNHIDHCIDDLRQVLMCAADVTPITSNWVHTMHSPHPDFNTMHKCRNFDKLLEYVEENDQGGVPRQTENPSWKPALNVAKTILDYEPDFPIPNRRAVETEDGRIKN